MRTDSVIFVIMRNTDRERAQADAYINLLDLLRSLGIIENFDYDYCIWYEDNNPRPFNAVEVEFNVVKSRTRRMMAD